MATIDTTEYMSTSDVAKALDLTTETVKKYCQKGDIVGMKVGFIWLIPKSEVKRFKANRRTSGRPPSKNK